MKTFLVTGGAGFIGSHVAQRLASQGHTVRIIDNLCTGYESNLAEFKDQIEFVNADVCDSLDLLEKFEGVDCVFHLAALASVPLSVEKPAEVNRACVDATLAVLQAAQQTGVRRVVYSASSACYGDKPFSANRESDIPDPMSPYAVAKLTGEYYCRAFYKTYGLETVCLRYFNVFGPRQDPNSHYAAVIPIFISRILNGKQPVVYGDGGQSRDFTFVSNVVDANILASTNEHAAGHVFNIADGRSITLLQLLDQLRELLKVDIEPIHDPPRVGEIRDSMADITQANRILGYIPAISFNDGLAQSIEHYRGVARGEGRELRGER